MLKLYQSIVLPHMEYGSTVCQIGKCEQLDKIQRKCLALCLGTPATSGRGSGSGGWIYAIRSKQRRISCQRTCKIMAKDKNEEIAKCFETWTYQTEEMPEKILSPFNKA